MDPMNPTNPPEEEVPAEETDVDEGEKYDGGEIPPAEDTSSNGEE